MGHIEPISKKQIYIQQQKLMQCPNHEKQDKEKAHKNMQHVHYYIKSDQLKKKHFTKYKFIT